MLLCGKVAGKASVDAGATIIVEASMIKARTKQDNKASEDMMKSLLKTIERIAPADEAAMDRAKAREGSLAKPPGSLGGLEDIAVRLAGIMGSEPASEPDDEMTAQRQDPKPSVSCDPLGPDCVIVFCADNGVATRGVSSAPQSVTRAQTINFTRRLTGVGALAKSFDSELLIVDMGVKETIPQELYDETPFRDTHRIIDRRIRRGTWDISEGPAMTEYEATKAMLAGMEMARAARDAGYGIIGIGEMGIGNTTTSAALLSALTGEGSEVTCGRGGGINDTSYDRKRQIVDACTEDWRRSGGLLRQLNFKQSIGEAGGIVGDDGTDSSARSGHETRKNTVVEERPDAVLKLLASCGGFDICAMTGAFLAAAACRFPVVIDGYISAVAALAAAAIEPEAVDYMFASHKSAEPGYDLAVRTLGLRPFLDLDMRLGEGSGCPIAFAVIRGAWDAFRNMGTFEEAEINDDYLEEIRAGGCF